jgi:hypothetical protein
MLRLFENRAWRKIGRPEREEVIGDWRKLHSEELHGWYTSPNIIRAIKSRIMRWAGHVARMEDGRGEYRVLVVKREGKRLLGRSVRRWKDNIEMYIEEIGCRLGMD